VRENNQTYRLGWTEQCKDGTRMGFGLPEYVHIFRKPQTDRAKGYADIPVVKDKEEYSRGRWQLDAHGFGRSSGNRLLTPAELLGQEAKVIFRRWREHSVSQIYDFERHVDISDALDANNQLPPTFMLLPPHSWHPDVETDVSRMRTLNGLQHAKGRELHLCPLQFDIVDRALTQYTMPGETVFDPFAGLMTVPYRALVLKRRGIGVELSPQYFRDGVAYCQEAERDIDAPTLFDLLDANSQEPSRIPEPTESIDPGQIATGGPDEERPLMEAKQPGEQDVGETITASARAVSSPALRAPAGPAVEKSGCGQAPDIHSLDPDELERRRALLAVSSGESVSGEAMRDLVGIGFVHITTSRLVITEEGDAWLRSSEIEVSSCV
jgi:hypothetical protein